MVTAIAFPKNLNVTDCLDFSCKLDRLAVGSYGIDFADFQHAPPFGMLLASSAIRRFAERMRLSGQPVKAANFAGKGYQAHMGFFQACGLQHGKAPGQATGSGTYVPLTKLNVDIDAGIAAIHERLNKQATRLTRLLLNAGDVDASARLNYCLFELMRNVAEHSGSKNLWFGAQAWPQTDTVEVAVLDEGVGLLANLAAKYQLKSDAEAVRKAIEEGVSGRGAAVEASGFGPQVGVDMDAEQSREDAGNSGYGLFVVSEMCRAEGSFALVSGNSCLILDGVDHQVIDAAHKGVAVRAYLRTRGEGVSSFIRRIATKTFGDTPSTRPRAMLDPDQ
jgi:hypothetical protein